MNDADEILEIVNSEGEAIGLAPRSEIHGNPSLIHRVVHVLVFNKKGELLLQKRSLRKDVAPGKWDTSVGGHINPGENTLEAAKRETEEELGIKNCKPEFLYTYTHTNPYETELVYTYRCQSDEEPLFNKDEIDEAKPWKIEEILSSIGKDIFSHNFEHEISTYLKFEAKKQSKQN